MNSKKGQTDTILVVASVFIWIMFLMAGTNYIGSMKEDTLLEKIIIVKQLSTIENAVIAAPGNVITSFSTKATPRFKFDFSHYGQIRVEDNQTIFYPVPYSKLTNVESDILNNPKQIIIKKQNNKIFFEESITECIPKKAKEGEINKIIKYKTQSEIKNQLREVIFLNNKIEIINDSLEDLSCIEKEIQDLCNYNPKKITGYNNKEYQKLGVSILIEGDNNICVDKSFEKYSFRKVGQLTYIWLK